MSRKENTRKHLRFGLYRTSTRTSLYGFSLLSANNSGSSNDGDALLLNVRFIPSTEDLHSEFCKVPKLGSSTDEGFRSSISQGNSTNQHSVIKDNIQIKDSESMQGPPVMIQSSSYNFNSLHIDTDNYLLAVRAAVTGDALQLLYLINVLKVSVNAANSQGITLLHWATANDHVAIIQLLLSLGADSRLTTKKGRSVLHTAAYNDAARCLKLFLKIFFEQEKKFNMKNSCGMSYKFILQRDFNGDNLLHLACRSRKKRCLKIIISFIIKYFGWILVEEMLQQCNQDNQTPVHVACLWNSVEAANLLLTDNLNEIINKIYNSVKGSVAVVALKMASKRALFWRIGRGTVLHEMATMKCGFACFTKHSSSLLKYDNKLAATELKMFLLGGCTVIETFEKRCPECEKARLEVVKIIMRCCPELVFLRDVFGQTALMCSVISDAVSLTKALLVYKGGKKHLLSKQLKSVDPDFRTALHHAAAGGRLLQVVLLLKCGATVRGQDSYGATPMHYAAVRGFCATLRLLYKANKYADELRTNDGHSAFMWAAINGVNISIRTMIDANPVVNQEDCDSYGCTALHLAAAGGHVEVINTLLLLKWNAEKQNKLGETPLAVAAKSGSAEAVRCFLHAGVDFFSQDKFNNTVLHMAANSDSKKETLRHLLHYLKDSSLLNTRNNMGQTPLHCATEHNAAQCVRYLLKCGADPLIRDNRGWDPLMVAVRQGCWSTIILMLKNSSNINCYSAADNQTTLSLALERKNYILASFLEKNGALLASEIQDTAARIIQRWYRGRVTSRCHRHTTQTHLLKGIAFSSTL
uniref:ANK_REP_REGION domain-containing protein n=1 Tax=Wuchereria bancrofti TaxID=6293 RepID=A0AAF5RT99_WUCBA